jgi:cellulose synthase/poly-beta-1,6-N-acetylglucosamine synthase-like glycosyltransferase
MVSIVVPVKNEEKVIGRLLKALLNLKYSALKMEIVIVNDESSDRTGEICNDYANRYSQVKVFNRPKSSTKAAALNYGAQHAKGEIIATFDADSVPESDALLNAVRYFRDPAVAAVQGRICSINANENMLTKFLFYEGAVQYEAFLRGKDKLNLFVSLAGTCQFIRRRVLEEVNGWNEKNLSEDVELSLRLTEKDYVIKYASEVRTWEESPHDIRGLVRQRARWYRGNITMGLKFGRLLRRLTKRRFDAEMSLFGMYLIVLCIASYFMAVWSFLLPPDFTLTLITRFTSLFTLVILAFAGVALVYVTKPIKIWSLLWLPFIYAYWGFQSFIALYAIFQIILRRPGKWSKTIRSGVVTAESAKEILATN